MTNNWYFKNWDKSHNIKKTWNSKVFVKFPKMLTPYIWLIFGTDILTSFFRKFLQKI